MGTNYWLFFPLCDLHCFFRCIRTNCSFHCTTYERDRYSEITGCIGSQYCTLLLREFIQIVIVANIIVWPIAYYVIEKWLESFVHRIDLEVEIFVVGGTLVLIISLAGAGYQTIKAAIRNPVDLLRDE